MRLLILEVELAFSLGYYYRHASAFHEVTISFAQTRTMNRGGSAKELEIKELDKHAARSFWAVDVLG
jgi:hypothetical protein